MSPAQAFNAASPLRAYALERPDAPALRVPSAAYSKARPAWDTVSFKELDRLSDAYARGLAARGLRAGDRALVLFKPDVNFYAVICALFKLGAVPVLIDPGMGLRALLRCIEQARVRALIAAPALHVVRLLFRRPFASAEILVSAGGRLPLGPPSLQSLREEADEPFPLAEFQGSDPAGIVFTSGSTGPPKGVIATQMLGHAQRENLREMLHVRPGMLDVQAFAAFALLDMGMGLCSVIPRIDTSRPATADPAEMVAAIQAFKPEVVFGSPIIWVRLGRYCLTHGIRLPSIRMAITVGAPISASLHRQFRQILSEDAELITPYGATEALPVTNIGSAEVLDETWERTARGHGTCVGRPAPGIQLHIIPISDAPVERWSTELALPAGELGEVVVSGAQVSTAYLDAPEADRLSKIRDGERILHRMGDLGYLDEQGRLWFCGRKVERLETADGVIAPVPVEGIFNEHPDVFRTALVGVGPRGRQVAVLCVEMEPGRPFSPAVVEALRGLAVGTRYEGLVQHFLAHPGFPTDARHNSKIRREELRSWAEERLRAMVPAHEVKP